MICFTPKAPAFWLRLPTPICADVILECFLIEERGVGYTWNLIHTDTWLSWMINLVQIVSPSVALLVELVFFHINPFLFVWKMMKSSISSTISYYIWITNKISQQANNWNGQTDGQATLSNFSKVSGLGHLSSLYGVDFVTESPIWRIWLKILLT